MTKSARALFLLLAVFLSACEQMEVPLPGSSGALFRDDFIIGRTGDWHLEEDDLGYTAIVPEQLVIQLDAPETVQYAVLREPTFDDFELTVDARQLKGSPESSYGILFRYQGPDAFYRFDITSSGLYVLERRNPDGTWERFTPDWRESPAINRGLNVVNQIKVVAEGPRIRVFVNDLLLEEIRDETYATGTIALDAGTFGVPGLQVAFDNVSVFPPGGGS